MKHPATQNTTRCSGRTASVLRVWIAAVAFSTAAGLPVNVSAEDLPFESGSTGADGPLIVPAHPVSRENPAMAFDPVREQLVLFGGNVSSTYYPETWVSDASGEGWREVSTTFVSGRHSAAMEWDAVNEVVVMFGGLRADNTFLDEFWAWDGTDWSPINVSPRPPARYSHSMVADPATGHVYVFGGRGVGNTNLNDLWRWNGEAWTHLDEVGTPPAGLNYRYFEAAWDSADNSILLYSSSPQRTWRFKDGVWNEIVTVNDRPNPNWGFRMEYDPVGNRTILFGGSAHRGVTWEFRDNDWFVLDLERVPARRYYHASAYDTVNDRIVMGFGWMDSFTNTISNIRNSDTWTFKDGEWSYHSGRLFHFDMRNRPDGIWNFTSIHVPANAEVRFIKNSTNTPVVWLATEEVRIDGVLRVDGNDAGGNSGADNYAEGGPGGFAGGLGGIRWDVSGSFVATPGQGPGGGAPGVNSGQNGGHAEFLNVYGNSLLLPLIGGSGGGGGASSNNSFGGHGGGGGGAILIASSRDIAVNGSINADGGQRAHGGASWGGHGSGGAIKLMADRVTGSGTLRARGGRSSTNNQGGRIRIEAFFRPLAANTQPTPSATAPIAAPDLSELPTLRVISVDGETVRQPPTGSLQNPDVVFTAAGVVTVVVQGTNVPQGTPVRLRVTTSGEIIDLPAPGAPNVEMNAAGTASFSATVPAGSGSIQAFAEF